ncbi:MAG: M13 family peptidase, partial [Sphingomonas sp.]
MRRTLIVSALLAGTAALAACAAHETPAPVAEVPVVAAAPTPPPAPERPKPTFGSFGFDAAGMDTTVKPGDNFYNFSNGTWAKTTPIPSDKANYGAFNILADLSQKRTNAILEEAKGDPNSKIGVAYSTYLDTATINAKGLDPIKPWLNQIAALKSKAGYPALVAAADRNGVRIPFGCFVGQDDKNPEVYVLNMFQGGIGMPDRDYYLSTDAKLVETRAAYEKHLTNVLTLAGEPNAAARAKAIVAFETNIAKVHWTRVDSRDANKTYNAMTVAELKKKAPGFDFAAYYAGIGAPVDRVIVAQPSAVAGIAKLIQSTPLAVLKDQLLVRSLDSYSDVLPEAFDKENFAFFGTILSGTPEQQVRWKRASDWTAGAL